eukprot:5922511-Prymnesium_polylepis.1
MTDFEDPVVIGSVPSTGAGLSPAMAKMVEPVAYNGNIYCGQKATSSAATGMKFYPLGHLTLLGSHDKCQTAPDTGTAERG